MHFAVCYSEWQETQLSLDILPIWSGIASCDSLSVESKSRAMTYFSGAHRGNQDESRFLPLEGFFLKWTLLCVEVETWFCFLTLCVWGFLLWISVEVGLRLRGSSGTTLLSTIKSVMYSVFCLFSPPFLFKLETNLFSPVVSIDLIISESVPTTVCQFMGAESPDSIRFRN